MTLSFQSKTMAHTVLRCARLLFPLDGSVGCYRPKEFVLEFSASPFSRRSLDLSGHRNVETSWAEIVFRPPRT